MKNLVFIAIILIFLLHSFAFNLECNFKHEVFFSDREISFTCFVEKNFKLSTNSTFRTIKSVQGVTGSPHKEVVQIHISEQRNMEYFPNGLTKFFKNLVAIHAGRNHLKYLVKDDLKEFKNLRFLYLYDNSLEELKSDVFEHTTALEYVSLHSNRLVHIGAKIL